MVWTLNRIQDGPIMNEKQNMYTDILIGRLKNILRCDINCTAYISGFASCFVFTF